MPIAKTKEELPDIQESLEGFPKKAIKKVGIRKVQLPVRIVRQDGSFNSSTGELSIYVDLNDAVKGINMSRLIITAEELIIDKNLALHEFIPELLKATKERLGCEKSYIKMAFDYFGIKEAPVSGTKSHMNYRCTIEGLHDSAQEFNFRTEVFTSKLHTPGAPVEKDKLYLTVRVPYTSLCPCSKNISQYGAHNQRSFADVKIKMIIGQIVWIEEIIKLVEEVVSAPIWNALKRVDEAWVTELAYEQPMFVEDMIREISLRLDSLLDTKISDYAVVVEHEEAIHTHNACAIITAGREMT